MTRIGEGLTLGEALRQRDQKKAEFYKQIRVARNRADQHHRKIWKAIVIADKKNPHLFRRGHGLGQETMSNWIRNSTGIHYPPKEVRNTLLWAVSKGWMSMTSVENRCTVFQMLRS